VLDTSPAAADPSSCSNGRRQPGARAGADPVRADAGLAVHLLPRCRPGHGGRPGRHADHRLRAQLCGDAHLSNFGIFASPERHAIFDVNDFDETLPGPFEWDVKRLAASLRSPAGTTASSARNASPSSWPRPGRTGRRCAGFADQSHLDVWYAHLDVDRELAKIKPLLRPDRVARTER
jgi:hypothetical protein